MTHIEELALADVLLLTARLFSSPADSSVFRIPAETLDDLAGRTGSTGAPALSECLRAAVALAGSTDSMAWRREHTRLFEGPVACPCNETGYIRRDKGAIIADLCGFYNAFGFEPAEASGEKPDHLVCELEFTAVLWLKSALARDRGDDEAVEITQDALKSYLSDHLGEWVPLFWERLKNVTALPLYVRSADLLASVWDAMAGRLGLPSADALDVGAGPDDEVEDELETPYECGMAERDAAELVTLTGPVDSSLPSSESTSER